MPGCLCIHWLGAADYAPACADSRSGFMSGCLCISLAGWQLCPSCGLCSGMCRQPQWVYVGVFMYSLPGWSGLCSGGCRQLQWVYVGVFMYSSAGWSFVLTAVYAPACADSRSGLMSGCLCIHWPGAADYAPACADSRSGFMSGCLCIHWLGAADYAPACADSRSGFMSGCLCIHWLGAAGSMVRIISYNSRGDALTTVYGFLRGLLMYLQSEYNCISRETVSYTSRGTNPDIVSDYPRAYI